MTPLERIGSRIFTRAGMQEQVKEWKDAGQAVVFTNGCFDIIHPGHINYLARASMLGNKFIVAVNSDSSVRKLKGEGRPLQDEKSRLMVLASLFFVDGVFLFHEDTPLEVLSELKPDYLVKGGDYTLDSIAGAKEVISGGGKVAIIPFLPGYSTTSIEYRMKKGNPDDRTPAK